MIFTTQKYGLFLLGALLALILLPCFVYGQMPVTDQWCLETLGNTGASPAIGAARTIYVGVDPADNNISGVLDVPTIPGPDIKANSSDGPIYISPGESATISIGLNADDMDEKPADWWVFRLSTSGFGYSTVQSPLINMCNKTLFIAYLETGIHIFIFAVDTIPDGIFQREWYDYVVVVSQQDESLVDLPNIDALVQKQMKALSGR